MKRFATFLLALVMILSLAIPAFAAGDNNTITIKNAEPGETYELFLMFDLTVDSETDPQAYTYTVNEDWAEFFAPNGAGYQYVTFNDNGAVENITDPAALAKAAAEWKNKPDEHVGNVANGNTIGFASLPHGYWLITSSLGTIAMTETTPDNETVVIYEKNQKPTITKQVKEGDEWGSENDVQVGDEVFFESVLTLQPNLENVKVTDTLYCMVDDRVYISAMNYKNNLVITDEEGNALSAEYYSVAANTNPGGFVVEFTDVYLESLEQETVLKLAYSATVQTNNIRPVGDPRGEFYINPQINSIKVEYNNEPSVEATTTTTHKFTVLKYDGADEKKDPLAGAVFSLKKDGVVVPVTKVFEEHENYYQVAASGNGQDTFTTIEGKPIVIWGVDSGADYTLEEITAPAGYNKLAEEVVVTVDAENTFVAEIANLSGTELPSTGGVGTTMFYIFGGILVLAAVVLLVTKKRMAVAE